MSKVGNSLDYKMEKVLAKINLPVRQPNDQVYHPLTKFMVPDAQLEAVNPEFETGLTLTHSVAGLHKLRPVAYPILPQRHAKPLPQSINLTDDQYITLGVIMSKCLTDGYPISKIMALNWLELSDWKIVPTLKHVKDFVDTHRLVILCTLPFPYGSQDTDMLCRPKLHMKLWDIYAENTLGWVSAKRLYEDDVHHVTSLCRIGSIDLAIGT